MLQYWATLEERSPSHPRELEFVMSKDEIKQLEKMIEVISRSIPKEQGFAKLYRKTAGVARREMNRMLFSKLGSQSEEHVIKLEATRTILTKELNRLKQTGEDAAEELGTCMPAHEFNVNIRQAMRLARELKKLAEKGLQDANDPSCRQMYDSFVEMSGEIRRMAEAEIDAHIIKDKWD